MSCFSGKIEPPDGETTWNYALPNGTSTPRQLTDASGEVTLAVRYDPWGDTLETYGTGTFQFGYFGGLMDAATGLLYIGNGQYYDPATGRFLTRDAKPESPNPYIPWNPLGAVLWPLGLLALVFRRKRGKHSRIEPYLFMLVILVVLPMSVGMACDGDTTPAPSNNTPIPPPSGTPAGPGNGGGGIPGTPTAPSTQPAITCPESSGTLIGEFFMSAYYIVLEKEYTAEGMLDVPIPSSDTKKIIGSHLSSNPGYYNSYGEEYWQHARWDFLYDKEGMCEQGTGQLKNGEYIVATKPCDAPWEEWGFEWQTKEKIEKLEKFNTVAVTEGIIPMNSEIVIPDLEPYMKERNADTTLKVVDTGEGLGPDPNRPLHKIDLFVGEGTVGFSHYEKLLSMYLRPVKVYFR